MRVLLKKIFGFAEHQEKETYGLGYKLTLTRNSENFVLNESNATNNAKFEIMVLIGMCFIVHMIWNNRRYYLNKFQPTELQNVERSIFMKEVNSRNFELLN